MSGESALFKYYILAEHAATPILEVCTYTAGEGGVHVA